MEPRNATKLSEEKEKTAQVFVKSILGRTIQCTLDDGRTATGVFICLDRLKNMILTNVEEQQRISSSKSPSDFGTDNNKYEEGGAIYRKRRLSQAMIPGKHLVKVHLLDK